MLVLGVSSLKRPSQNSAEFRVRVYSISLPLHLLGLDTHSLLVTVSIDYSHTCALQICHLEIHVPRLFVGACCMHRVGNTMQLVLKSHSHSHGTLNPRLHGLPKLHTPQAKRTPPLKLPRETLKRLANQEGCELLSPRGICNWPLVGHVALDMDLLISASSPYPLAVVVGSPVILSAQRT